MSQCHYHPDKRGTATCPNCQQPICDRCRLNGTSQRCAACQTQHNKGSGDPSKRKGVRCANHADIPTDLRCAQCKKPHCPACLNGAQRCFQCALAGPAPGPAGPRSGKRKAGAPGKKGAKGKGRGKAASAPALELPRWLPWGVAAIVLVGALAAGLALRPKPKPLGPVRGPLGVSIGAPAPHSRLTGPQVLRFKVRSARDLRRVEVTIDGKYWDKLKQPPYQSDWPTSIFPNGRHTVRAVAVYRDGQKATTQAVYTTRNRH